jgi:hypothetical protein
MRNFTTTTVKDVLDYTRDTLASYLEGQKPQSVEPSTKCNGGLTGTMTPQPARIDVTPCR